MIDHSSGDELRADGGEEIPLDIAGHEDREKPSESDVTDGGGEKSEEADRDSPISDAEELLEESPADPEPDPEDDEVEPVELLVQLAKDGEIEPWDIDIVAVTDTFLDALDERDLRTSGRALFYASVLLRMKSDALLEDDDEEEPEAEEDLPPWEAPPAEEGGAPAFDPVDALEAEMDRRLERKHARGSPETLDELVRDLRDAERSSWWKESRTYDTSESPQGFRRGVQELDYRTGDDFRMDDEPTEAEAIGTAHQEDIEETIADVQAALDEQYDGGRTEVLYDEIAQTGGSLVETFLALLFLAHRGAVRLQQDDLFGDLWVRDASPQETEAPATAD
ncbi:segregation and condensation protein A [Halobacterium zhouii]|uniref:segregation and condensation protein A n=1 Tax=Halobacterium zhouii TaxID=2902624 RepID=UPI001E3B08F1|nr:ScpA family protein [Halobacterium zhouii]